MSKNTFKTFVLLAAFGGLLIGIGSLFGTGGLIIGLAIGLVFVGGSYWFSDKLAVKAAGAQPVTEQEAPELYAIVRDLAQRDGIPMPRIYISPAAQPNAFATGRGPNRGGRGHAGAAQILDRTSAVCLPTSSAT
jgi:heat shock protein HtpX